MSALTAAEKVYIWLDSFPLDEKEKKTLLKAAALPTELVRRFPDFAEILIKEGKESVYNSMTASLQDGGEYFRGVVGELDKADILPVTLASDLYPEELKKMSTPPLVLYAKGNAELLKTRKFTVVGSRLTPVAARKLGMEICKELSEAFTLVTGTADGGDCAAIEGALAGSGKVICVLAGGFSALPQGNLEILKRAGKSGLILSAHTYPTPVRAFSFESRNALLARLGEGVLVLGAGEKSGALITAKYAKEYSKPVFALPYAPNTAAGVGCNALIKKGGYLTENSVDILGRFGINLLKEKNPPALSEEEERVLSALRELGEAHVTELSAAVGVPVFKLYGLLSALEVKNLAARLGGNRFAPV